MADAAQQLLEAVEAFEEVADNCTAHEALQEVGEAPLQLFWRDWPRIQSWAGSLWRELDGELAEVAAPSVVDSDTGGGD